MMLDRRRVFQKMTLAAANVHVAVAPPEVLDASLVKLLLTTDFAKLFNCYKIIQIWRIATET